MKVIQFCPTLWPHGLYSPWNSPSQNTGVGSLSLLQGIFPTQGLNPGLPHCRWILYQLSSVQLGQLGPGGLHQPIWGRKLPGEGMAPAKVEKPKGQLCRWVCFGGDWVRRNREGLRREVGLRTSKCLFSSAFIKSWKTSKPRQILGAFLSAKEFFFSIVWEFVVRDPEPSPGWPGFLCRLQIGRKVKSKQAKSLQAKGKPEDSFFFFFFLFFLVSERTGLQSLYFKQKEQTVPASKYWQRRTTTLFRERKNTPPTTRNFRQHFCQQHSKWFLWVSQEEPSKGGKKEGKKKKFADRHGFWGR